MHRYLEPELLDHLDPEHPDAVQSRAELLLINRIMGNHRWLLKQLRPHLAARSSILELGAGDGEFSKHLIDSKLCEPHQIHALDLMPPPAEWPSGAHWIQRSIFDPDAWPRKEVVIANLFLHHFTDEQLREIGNAMRHARLVIVCEPARRSAHLAQGALLAALCDFNRVTCHDMMVSIRAGFLGDELQTALGLNEWKCDAAATLLGAYHFAALNPCVSSP